MAKFVNITGEDTIRDTVKVTAGFFTGNVGTVAGSALATASLSSGQGEYYYTLQKSSEDQFSVAYGHKVGSGSSDTIGQTQAIYKQFGSMLLTDAELETGFVVNEGGTMTSQSDMYFIIAERARMKDRVNRKNWTIILSGSAVGGASWGGTAGYLKLTDNSAKSSSVATPAGPRYEVVSGSDGNMTGYTQFGYFWPRVGVWALSGNQLSSSLPGTSGYINSGSPAGGPPHMRGVGFARDTRTNGNANNAGKLVNSILLGQNITLRSEEDQTSVAYFCRAKAQNFNFSNNPTFSSGSENGFRNTDMEGNPQTFVTTVGLYNASNLLVAVGRLSTPVQKNYQTEATVKVNLTY